MNCPLLPKKFVLIHQPELWRGKIIGARYRGMRRPRSGTHASPKMDWRKGPDPPANRVHQGRGFFAVSSLPRREDGEIDWLVVSEETRCAFWRCHTRMGGTDAREFQGAAKSAASAS
jgi:hypothetical protein